MTVDKSIFIKNVYYMLAYAFKRLNKEDYRELAKERFDNIHELFAEIIALGVTNQVKQGLYREYVPMQEELSVMRGKLNINDTIRLQVQKKQKLACEFDEFSEDNLYNQILKMTMLRLVRTQNLKKDQRQKLKKLMIWFDNVTLIRPEMIPWSRLTYQRSNSNYELLINICYLLLDGMLQTTEDGQFRLMHFSHDQMNLLFQNFVLNFYKKEFPDIKASSKQLYWSEDNSNPLVKFLPVMQTDILLETKQSDRKLIIDTKYYEKIMLQNHEKFSVSPGNLYQILSYVKNMDKDNVGNVSGLLLYARTDEDYFPSDGEPIAVGNNLIDVKTLDLNTDFECIRTQLRTIAEKYVY